jgi:hypothetical protein
MKWEIWKAKIRANLIMARLDLKALSNRLMCTMLLSIRIWRSVYTLCGTYD